MSVVPITREFGRALAVADRSRPVVGSDLILTHTREGEIALYALRDGAMSAVGTFENPADAWRALDELDAPEQVSLAA
jgi:hypothetical protein